MQNFGRSLLFFGIFIAFLGLALTLAGKFNLPFGKLPGDITYHKKNFTVFAPLGTMFLISIIITLILNIISRWKH